MLVSQTAVFLTSLYLYSFPIRSNGCYTTPSKPGFSPNFFDNNIDAASYNDRNTTISRAQLALPAITDYSTVPQPSQSAAATLFPIPESFVKKILRLEYVDMAELKPNACSCIVRNQKTQAHCLGRRKSL